MNKELEHPIIFGGTKYYFVEQFIFDCTSINMRFGGGGGYYTTIPISPLEYRIKPENIEYFFSYSSNSYPNRKKSCVEILKNEIYTVFQIYSDYGDKFIIEIPNFMKKEINFAIHSAI